MLKGLLYPWMSGLFQAIAIHDQTIRSSKNFCFFQVGIHGFCWQLLSWHPWIKCFFFLASIGLLALGGFLFNIKRETVFQSWRPNPIQIGGLTESHWFWTQTAQQSSCFGLDFPSLHTQLESKSSIPNNPNGYTEFLFTPAAISIHKLLYQWSKRSDEQR